MLIYVCSKGHRYATAGYGEDLTNNTTRPGNADECPECRRLEQRAALAERGKPLVNVMVERGIAHSLSVARRLIEQQAVCVDGQLVTDINSVLNANAKEIRVGKLGERGKQQ
jgi:tyrosyl-tRNA synthetase